MSKIGVITKALLPIAIVALTSGVSYAADVALESGTVPVGGGATQPSTLSFSYVGDADTVGFECFVTTPAEATVVSVSPPSNCAIQGSGDVKIEFVDGALNPIPDMESVCEIEYDIHAAAAAGDVYNFVIRDCLYSDISLNPSAGPHTATDGQVTVTSEGPPTLTFDTTPVALPAGPYGSTQSGTIPANFTASTGAHSVDYTCTAPAGFTVTPATGSYDNDDTTATDLTVTATLTGAAQAGTVTCTVTPSDGSTPTTFDIDVSAPAGTESAPALTPTPADGGEITVGGGAPGSNGTGTLTVTPSGGAGTDVAEVFCEADAPVSISPASLTFPVGSSAQGFTVTVPLTDAAQTFPGAIGCWGEDGNGGFEWVFDVSAPAGVAAPTFIPATSLWSKFALIGVFAALGLLMVGLRRNH